MKQSLALDILKTGQNVFLTGSAGSGKTYTLNQYIHYLRARQVPVAVTASTGIAATHMSGTTIHSWSGIGIKDALEERDLANLSRKKMLRDRVRETTVLIIDEISMLHAKQLNLVNQVLQHLRHNSQPFGGIQVVVAGDFFQLPPIGRRDESNRDKFAFMSEAWLEANFSICYLTEQHRQDGNTGEGDKLNLDTILNQIRQQNVSQEAIDTLQDTFHQDVDINRTRLYTHNLNVNTINEKELAKLDSEAVTYTAIAHGENKLVDTLKKSVRTSDDLNLKVGAKVMFIKNNSEMGVSNGTMGEIVGFIAPKSKKEDSLKGIANKFTTNTAEDDIENDIANDTAVVDKGSKINDDQVIESDSTDITDLATDDALEDGNKVTFKPLKYPMVRLNSGRRIVTEPDEWSIEDETGEVLASYSQVPLSLAWAITIHKSQGMTLDAAEIDLSKTFELGQGYVALSRLKSLEGLKLLGMNDMSLRLDPLARGADNRFQELSMREVDAYQNRNKTELQETQDAFILTSGGTLSEPAIKSYESLRRRRHDKQKTLQLQKDKLGNQLSDESQSTLMATKLLLDESLSIAEVAQGRGLAQATIMTHLDKLKKQDSTLRYDHLRPDDNIVDKVAAAVKVIKADPDPENLTADGQLKLRPVYEHLREKIDYNTIRLAMIFIED